MPSTASSSLLFSPGGARSLDPVTEFQARMYWAQTRVRVLASHGNGHRYPMLRIPAHALIVGCGFAYGVVGANKWNAAIFASGDWSLGGDGTMLAADWGGFGGAIPAVAGPAVDFIDTVFLMLTGTYAWQLAGMTGAPRPGTTLDFGIVAAVDPNTDQDVHMFLQTTYPL
jgi:hypothetical protein